jgi:predicted dehydrogenase
LRCYVFIATRHDSHAHYVLSSLRAGKHVFVEKPLCLHETELAEIRDVYQAAAGGNETRPHLMVGFNRRFSPLTLILKEMVRSFVGAVRDGGNTPIPFEQTYAVSLATFKILESLRMRSVIPL